MAGKARVVFMGAPEFALATLSGLAREHTVAGVVTQPDRPAGRGRVLAQPPVKRLAVELGLPVIQPGRLSESGAMEQLHAWAPELIVVAAFGQILKPEVLALPPHGCVNVHASLLPRWRGAAPINAAILHGDAQSGVTIMKMDAGLDTGPILSQRAVPIGPEDTAGSLYAVLSELGAALLLETLPGYLAGEIAPRPQPEHGATYAPMLKKEDGRLDFTRTAEALARQVRAFHPWPGTFTAWQGEPLKVLRARSGAGKAVPGERLTAGGLPAVGTSDGLLVLEEVQPAGKRPMSGKAFLAGAQGWLEQDS